MVKDKVRTNNPKTSSIKLKKISPVKRYRIDEFHGLNKFESHQSDKLGCGDNDDQMMMMTKMTTAIAIIIAHAFNDEQNLADTNLMHRFSCSLR